MRGADGRLRLLSDYLRVAAEKAPEHECIVGENYRVTYGECWETTTHLSKFLLDAGVKRGDAVAYLLPPGPEFVYLYMAGARIGALMVGLNPQYSEPELEYILDNAQPKVLVVMALPEDADRKAQYARLMERIPSIKTLLVAGGGADEAAVGFSEGLRRGADVSDDVLEDAESQVSSDDGVLVVYTSGTTGRPKGAVLTHRNIIANIDAEVKQWNIVPEDRLLLHLPVNHVGGATELTFAALMAGATLVAMPSFHPVTTLETVARERVTLLGQVPAMYAMEFALPNFEDFDLSSVRIALVAGAAPTREIIHGMFRHFPDVRTGYGMSEVAGFATYTAAGDSEETVFSTVGRIDPAFQLKIVDKHRQEVPVGEVGEVALRGPFVMKGYLRLPEETSAAVDEDGWFYTGDLGTVDENGYLRLVGRLKEMYITGGYNVYPAEIEDVLSQHPDVMMAACLGVPHTVLGEVGRAFVLIRPGATVTAEEIEAFAKERLADYKIPREFVLRDKLPLTPLGKIDKKALQAEIDAGTSS